MTTNDRTRDSAPEGADDPLIKVFLSSIACHPDMGSEPGVGWRWVCGLAGRVQLTVLTRSIHREAIVGAVAAAGRGSALQNVRFVYHDLPQALVAATRRRLLPLGIYYILWQWDACGRFHAMAESNDVVHHLTLCTLLCPGFWKPRTAAFVIGPVGAPLVAPSYYALFGHTSFLQKARGALLRNFHLLPWLRPTLAKAAAIVPANTSTKELLERRGIAARQVMLDTGAPELGKCDAEPRRGAGDVVRFVYAGRLERRKGLELAIRAVAAAIREDGIPLRFDIMGDGPDLRRLRRMVGDLGLENQVGFTGKCDRADVFEAFLGSDVFIFTSVRDTSGGVNLEAMACGLPVICIAHQGVGDITTDTCAIRVAPGGISQTIASLADAVRRMADDPERRHLMGREASRRARSDFSWDAKFDRMVEYYREITGAAVRAGTRGNPPGAASARGGLPARRAERF